MQEKLQAAEQKAAQSQSTADRLGQEAAQSQRAADRLEQELRGAKGAEEMQEEQVAALQRQLEQLQRSGSAEQKRLAVELEEARTLVGPRCSTDQLQRIDGTLFPAASQIHYKEEEMRDCSLAAPQIKSTTPATTPPLPHGPQRDHHLPSIVDFPLSISSSIVMYACCPQASELRASLAEALQAHAAELASVREDCQVQVRQLGLVVKKKPPQNVAFWMARILFFHLSFRAGLQGVCLFT